MHLSMGSCCFSALLNMVGSSLKHTCKCIECMQASLCSACSPPEGADTTAFRMQCSAVLASKQQNKVLCCRPGSFLSLLAVCMSNSTHQHKSYCFERLVGAPFLPPPRCRTT